MWRRQSPACWCHVVMHAACQVWYKRVMSSRRVWCIVDAEMSSWAKASELEVAVDGGIVDQNVMARHLVHGCLGAGRVYMCNVCQVSDSRAVSSASHLRQAGLCTNISQGSVRPCLTLQTSPSSACSTALRDAAFHPHAGYDPRDAQHAASCCIGDTANLSAERASQSWWSKSVWTDQHVTDVRVTCLWL